MSGLTKVHSNTLQFIRGYVAIHGGASPSYEEIAEALGLKSRGRVCQIVKDLEGRGAIVREPRKARSIALKETSIGSGFVVNPVGEVRAAIEAYAREHGITIRTAAEEALRAYFVEPRAQ
jgi:SOS-response transcriptional repressor LexA